MKSLAFSFISASALLCFTVFSGRHKKRSERRLVSLSSGGVAVKHVNETFSTEVPLMTFHEMMSYLDSVMTSVERESLPKTGSKKMLPIFQLMDSYLTKQQDLAATSPMTEERNRMARQLAYTLAAHDMRIRHSCRALREKRDVSGYNALRGGRYFFGLTLQNAEESLKELVLQLLDIIDFLGPGNVYLSIYENGSEDDSKDFLVNMDVLLTLFNVDHTIVTDIEGRPHDVDAVEYLAKKRNRALEPLMDGNSGPFDRVVILDGLVLELLHEASTQGADMACGTDFRLLEGENEKRRRLGFACATRMWRERETLKQGAGPKGQICAVSCV
mmetsp:Transcript_52749/g.132585  ORF Transcript_52749/g.132585 Transcript_52749/m.132585 type:complete len:330 (-) Transcript_52749:759-1748(-)